MTEPRHEFENELDSIEGKVIELFAMVAEDLPNATAALLNGGDDDVLALLIERDQAIDALYREIEQLVNREILLQAPVAKDLRFLLSVLRIVPELERSHDLVVHIATRANHIFSDDLSVRARRLVQRMGELAASMWRQAADSWYQRDRSAAQILAERDEEMDELHASLIAELASGQMSIPVTMEMTLGARDYERLGAHAVNIARRVVYLAGSGPEGPVGSRLAARVRDGQAPLRRGGKPAGGGGPGSLSSPAWSLRNAWTRCPRGVLAAFGVAEVVPERLPGGQGTTWRAGPVVLKPADSVRAGRWAADVCDGLTGPGFAVPRPVRAAGGDWVARGWTAWQWVPGAPADWSGVSPRWPELIAVSRALHAALAEVRVPAWWATVENPWTIGDRVAWGERDPGPLLGPAAGRLAGPVRRLLAALRPVDLPDQLLHADLAGNVLFADGAPPAVIDFSPLERPAGLPLAIAAVDILQWHRAQPEVLDQLADEPELDQMLARALIYRLITDIIRHAGTAGIEAAARAAEPVTDLVLTRLGR